MPDPHVIIPDEDPIVQYAVGGTPDDTFVIPFTFFSSTDIKVYNGALLISSEDYIITGNAGTTGGFAGGQVVLDSSVTNTTITILRDVPSERSNDFPISGPFNITSLNTDLDKIFAILQQQERMMGRALTVPDTDPSTIITTLPAAATRANKILAFDADGDMTITTLTVSQIESAVTSSTSSAAAAAASAAAAAISESSAAASAAAATSAANDVLAAVDGLAIEPTINRFSGTGSQTDFTLTIDPGNENNTRVYVDGEYQQKNTYSVTGTTLAFASAPNSGTDNIEVEIGGTLPIGTPSDNTVTTVKIANNAVTTAKINDGAVTAGKIGDNAVTTAKILDANVTTAKINDGAVTADKLGSNAVTTAKILDANVTDAKLASGVGTSAGNLVKLDGSAKLPAVDGSQLTNLPGGSYVRLGKVSVTNQATLDITAGFTSAYETIKIFLRGVRSPAGVGTGLNMRFSANNGSSYVSNANYHFVRRTVDYGTTPTVTETGFPNPTTIELFVGVQNSATNVVDLEITLHDVRSTSRHKSFTFVGSLNGQNGKSISGAGSYSIAANIIDAVRFYLHTGNITGEAEYYGLKNS